MITVHTTGVGEPATLPESVLGAIVVGPCYVRKDGAYLATAVLLSVADERVFVALWWDRYADPPRWALTAVRP